MSAPASSLKEATSEAGFVSPPVSELAFPGTFRDVDQLLAWIWSHFGLGVLRRIPPERLPAVREELAVAEPLTITARVNVLTACRT